MAMSNKTYSLCIDGEVISTGSSRKINDLFVVCSVVLKSFKAKYPNVSDFPVISVVVNM